MAVYNTSGFLFKIGSPLTAVPGIVDASVTLTLETVDVTEIGNADRAFVNGIRTGSASGNLYYDQGNAQVAALESAVRAGTTVACEFTLHANATITATAYVTSWSPSVAVSDVVRVAFELQFTGAYTIA